MDNIAVIIACVIGAVAFGWLSLNSSELGFGLISLALIVIIIWLIINQLREK